MDSFQLNKIAGAVLGTLTVLLGVNAISEGLFHHKKPEKPGFEVAEGKKEGGGEAAGGAGGGGVAALLASADPAKGEQAAKKCGACHSFGKGEPAKLGPNLYGVIGLPHAHMEGFAYSDAMKKTHDTKWDFANIDKWLEDPKAYIPGNKMAFAGVKDPKERANIIAYLNKNSEKPLDLPKGGDKPAEGGGDKPAAGGAPAGGGDDAFVAKVAAADPAKGEQVSKRCAACHSFKKDEPAKVGPNLYGILGLPHAHMEGFGYSDAMKKTHDKIWDVANLSHWLEDPKGYIPGNKMAFAGVKNEDERASLIAYLNKNSDKPVDLKAAGGGDKKPEGDKKTEAAPAKPEEKKAEAPAAAPPAEEKKAEAPAAAPAAPAGGDKPAAAPAAGGDVNKLLASADAGNGEKIVQEQCAACHTFNKGGEAGAGPNLYGIVGSKHAHQDGFEYSDAFKAHQQSPWDFALLDQWLTDPAKVVQGTMMAFPGIQDPKQRADVIAYLNKNSDKPVDLPK